MYWYNGAIFEDDRIHLDTNDPGLLYGATLFTTVRVYRQSLDHPLTHWQAHLTRLRSSVQAFGWLFPDWARIQRGANQLCDRYPVLRIAIFPDGREWIIGRSLPADLSTCQQRGIIGWVADHPLYQRSLSAHKTGNYLPPWLATREATVKGAREAILVDRAGNWLETGTGNLWGWYDGCWYTPALAEGILGGVARAQILLKLQERAIPVQERRWTPDWCQRLEVLAYSNCVVEIIPFDRVLWGESSISFLPTHPALETLRNFFFERKN